MGFFDFFKSDSSATNGNNPSIDLSDYKFLSDDHTRIQNGHRTNANNKGAWRGIRVKSSDSKTFYVTMYNMNENHPVWGDNIQMAEKRMKLINESSEKIILRGYGIDAKGSSFADYGLTLHKSKGQVNKISLHMHDRNIDIVYEKAEDINQMQTLNKFSDFDSFKDFTHRWNTSMPMQEKMQIARQSDAINNKGVHAYNADNINFAIAHYEEALKLMPNNDDALENLRICYSEIGNHIKANEMKKKLDYLS